MGRDERNNPANLPLPAEKDGVLDRLGRKLQVGDEVIMVTQGPVIFRVVEIAPLLDPRLPPGAMKITVGCAVDWFCPKGQKNAEFILVREAGSAGPLNLSKLPGASSIKEGEES